MNKLLLTGTAALVAASAGAYAQTSSTRVTDSSSRATTASSGMNSAPPSTGAASRQNIREALTQNLEKAGFTDVRVVPDSFLVQAKDSSGNPVTMFINPDSLEVLSTDNGSGSLNTRSGQGGMFTNIPASEDLSSKVVGLDVYNSQNQDIGKIKDVAFDGNRVRAYIVGVGGFLGMGDHYVAVMPSAINIHFDQNNKTWHAAMNATADQLKAAPEYKYASNS
jgi:hypothetical protein